MGAIMQLDWISNLFQVQETRNVRQHFPCAVATYLTATVQTPCPTSPEPKHLSQVPKEGKVL